MLDIILIHIMCICIVHKNCIILHFHALCDIKEKCVELLLFETFFLSSSKGKYKKIWFPYVRSNKVQVEVTNFTGQHCVGISF